MYRLSVFILAFPFCSILSQAQAVDKGELFTLLKQKDSLLFKVGYDQCDIQQFEQLLSDNFEFYHDKSGFTFSKVRFIDDVKNGLCKLPYKARRELVEKSLEVFPLTKNGTLYGAIQNGVHKFYATEKSGEEHLTSIAKFTSVWVLEQGKWKVSRVLSYDHKEP